MDIPIISLDGAPEDVSVILGVGLQAHGCVFLMDHGIAPPSIGSPHHVCGEILGVVDAILAHLDRFMRNCGQTLQSSVENGPSSTLTASAGSTPADPLHCRIALLAFHFGYGEGTFEAQDLSGVWHAAEAPSGMILVRAGELLREWQRDLFPMVGFRNLAWGPPYVAYYLQPDPDTLLYPVPRTTVEQYRARRMQELTPADLQESS